MAKMRVYRTAWGTYICTLHLRAFRRREKCSAKQARQAYGADRYIVVGVANLICGFCVEERHSAELVERRARYAS